MLFAPGVSNHKLKKLLYRVWCLSNCHEKVYNISKFQVNPFINNRDIGDRGIGTTSKSVHCSVSRTLGTRGKMLT